MSDWNPAQEVEGPLPVYVAVGDVHGQDRLLEQLYAVIAEETAALADRPRYLVHLGDYVDRGPASRQVIARIRAGLPGFTTVALRGNHEQMMLDAVTGGSYEAVTHWLRNGGRQALASYESEDGEDTDSLLGAAMFARRYPEDVAWLASLPFCWRTGPYLFVHAGLVPGRPLEEQWEKDLIWIRDAFLNSLADHGCLVVHGHTPTYDGEPEVRPNRINLDTGAAFGGPLTAAILDGDWTVEPTFLQVYP